MAPNEKPEDPKSTDAKTSDDIDSIKEEFFYDILEKKYGKFKMIKFNVEKAIGAGENYISIIFRVFIEIEKTDGKIEANNYIAKFIPKNKIQNEMLKQMKVFEKEVEMYERIIPKFEEIFRDHGETIAFVPKCWKTMQDPELFIMEDLKMKNFENIDRLKGMNMEHAKATLSKLAKFHAASACVFDKFGPYSEQLMADFYNEEMAPTFREMHPQMWALLIKNMEQWDSCKEYIDKLSALGDRIFDNCLEAYERDPDEFNVMVHGDFWCNNIMFQHGECGNIKDVLFVDLQLSRFGSPVQDLLYFIISSTENDIKIKEFDYFIKYYHSQLTSSLKLLEYGKKIPTLIDLHVQLVKRGFIGVTTCFGVMSAVLLDPNENASIENFMEETDVANQLKNDIFMNPRYIKACEILLPFFENRGHLDM